MARTSLTALGIASVAMMAALATCSPASAYEFGSVGVYSDAVGGSCTVTDVAGVVEVYVVLTGSDGAAQVAFAVRESEDLMMTYLDGPSVVHFPLVLGNLHTGIQVTFGACRTGPVHIATLVYDGSGTTSPCEAIRVVPHPGKGAVEVWDCAQNRETAPRGGMALVSNDGGCVCDVATRTTTWGRIKSLYE